MNKTTLLTLLLHTSILLNSTMLSGQSTAKYDINFTSVWNSTDHGTLPSSAHWSDLVGATHNSNVTFLEMGGTATTGIENVAETGNNSIFMSEVQSAIDDNNADQWLQEGFSPFAAISSATLSDITVSEDFPLVSLVSMIAPSPDWIIAVNSINLRDNSNASWKSSIVIDLFPYDAGTEDGFGYSGNNAATIPRGVVTNVAGAIGYPFNSNKIGTLTITRTDALSINDNLEKNDFSVFPNPSEGLIMVKSSNSSIEDITIFNVLGSVVKRYSYQASKKQLKELDLSMLKKGIYILRVSNNEGEKISKKIVLR